MAPGDLLSKKFLSQKQRGEKIAMITASDFSSGKIVEESGADIVLVGDSLGVTILGYESTHQVTMEDMIHHLKAVARGVKKVPVIGDLPIDTYRNPEEALRNSLRMVSAGAGGVKIEGCLPLVVEALVARKIPVMGHIGLTPQSFSDYKVQGKVEEDATRLKKEAKQLEAAGCFLIVLEAIPSSLAEKITTELTIPTVGIGAGKNCDGQVLVFNDLLGIFDEFKPKFVRRYKNLKQEMVSGCRAFVKDIRSGEFPSDGEMYH